MPITLSGLWIHPVKSCAPLAAHAADVRTRGLAHDRRFMVVDPDGRFLTGRQIPRLATIRAVPDGHGVRLDASSMTTLHVAAPPRDGERIGVSVWKDRVEALECSAAADAWLTACLGRPARLVYMDEAATRGVDPTYGWATDEVSFADGFPLLLISQASLDALNARLLEPITMARFRPNLVVSGCEPHAEDGWHRIQVGFIEMEVVKPCTRCVFTTVDPVRGELDPSGEPLATLKTYRRGQNGVTFGQNVIPRAEGTIRLGDTITVLE